MKQALLGLGALVLAYAVVVLVLVPRALVEAERFPITRTPAEVGLVFRDVSFQPADEAITLRAWWMEAARAETALVFLHGGGSNRHTDWFRALDFYRAMVDRSVSVLAVDLRNHGASDAASTGLQFGRTEKEDLQAAVRWVSRHAPALDRFAMGISMGGSTVVQAAHDGLDVSGAILLDPLLETRSTFVNAVHIVSGIPKPLLVPAAWSATRFFGLPDGSEGALHKLGGLELPVLLIVDPTDPATEARYAEGLEGRPGIEVWRAPAVDPTHPALARKGAWGAHVSAFELFPEQTLRQIGDFMARSAARRSR